MRPINMCNNIPVLGIKDSIPDGITGIFSGSNMARKSTQLLTEMSIRAIPWGIKAAGA
jgi:hypothetical protein